MSCVYKAFDHILKLRIRYLEALEKYEEIEVYDKREYIKKFVKIKGKLRGGMV